MNNKRLYFCFKSALIGGFAMALVGCESHSSEAHVHHSMEHKNVVDITDRVFQSRSADCATYADLYGSTAKDVRERKRFYGEVQISIQDDRCVITSNNIPNHDFNDGRRSFFNETREVSQRFIIQRSPQQRAYTTLIDQRMYNGVMLNGVPIDLLSASCYSPNSRQANRNGNVPIGCRADARWLVDPLGPSGELGADSHHAHTQPNGSYHYHGNPNAMFDDNPSNTGSPVIGFAADGFPIYGSYFYDDKTGKLRKALSGYRLKSGYRPNRDQVNPGGKYDGTYIQDWQFTNAGDLDECNGMTVNGQYGYYVTDQYPWIMNCFKGQPDSSFEKQIFGRGDINPMRRPPRGHFN